MFKAADQIFLGEGFKVERNAIFKAYTFECSNAANYRISTTETTSNHINTKIVNHNTTPNIFPNPTKGKLTITQLEQFVGGNIEIINLMGQVIFSKTIQNHQMSVNLSEYNKGIYLVKISSDKQQIIEKIVLE